MTIHVPNLPTKNGSPSSNYMSRGAYFVWLPTSKMAKNDSFRREIVFVAQTTGLILGVDIRLGGGVLPLKYELTSSNYMFGQQL